MYQRQPRFFDKIVDETCWLSLFWKYLPKTKNERKILNKDKNKQESSEKEWANIILWLIVSRILIWEFSFKQKRQIARNEYSISNQMYNELKSDIPKILPTHAIKDEIYAKICVEKLLYCMLSSRIIWRIMRLRLHNEGNRKKVRQTKKKIEWMNENVSTWHSKRKRRAMNTTTKKNFHLSNYSVTWGRTTDLLKATMCRQFSIEN